jgi:serine/threonine protein kinase
MLIDVGQVVAKKYELVRLLGRGSMGEVWSAYHQALREQVALKVLNWPPSGEVAEEPAAALARFRFEAQVAARLSRKTRHIARVTDYGEDDGFPYLVMELLDGEALDAALRRRGALPPSEAAPIVSQIARALDQAHAEPVAHRDLKPANVFLTRDEEGHLLVKLLDFGIARTIHAHRVQSAFTTEKGFVFGTPGYMSPEQTRASPKLDHRCDLWALATIAYQMLTGHLPVEGADADEIMKNLCAGRIVPLRQREPRLPVALGDFFDRAFADRIDDRFDGASLLAQAFEVACQAPTALVPAPAPSIPEETTGSTGTEFSATVGHEVLQAHRRPRTKVALAVGAAVLAAILALGGIWRTFTGSRAVLSNATAPLPIEPVIATAEAVRPASSESPVPAPSSEVAREAPVPRATARLNAGRVEGGPSAAVVPGGARATDANAARATSPAHVKSPPDATSPRSATAGPRPPEDRNDVF